MPGSLGYDSAAKMQRRMRACYSACDAASSDGAECTVPAWWAHAALGCEAIMQRATFATLAWGRMQCSTHVLEMCIGECESHLRQHEQHMPQQPGAGPQSRSVPEATSQQRATSQIAHMKAFQLNALIDAIQKSRETHKAMERLAEVQPRGLINVQRCIADAVWHSA